ncbi:MAG: hypothetical protein R3F35_22715 [Myxococcota bacterium]
MGRPSTRAPSMQAPGRRRAGRSPAGRLRSPGASPGFVVGLGLAALIVASCERTPTKSDYIDARVQVECADRTGEAFRLCRLDVIKKYMRVPLESLQAQFPPPKVEGRMGCG